MFVIFKPQYNNMMLIQKYISPCIALLALLCPLKAAGQVIYASKYSSDADIKIYVTKYKTDADIVVYKTKYKSDADGNSGIWYFTEYKSDAKKKIYFTDYKSDAALLVHFTEYKSDAGWINKNKQHYLY